MSESSRNVRIVRIYPLTVLFTFTMVIIINSILGLITIKMVVARQQFKLLFIANQLENSAFFPPSVVVGP